MESFFVFFVQILENTRKMWGSVWKLTVINHKCGTGTQDFYLVSIDEFLKERRQIIPYHIET